MTEGSFHIHVHDLCLDVGTKLTASIHVSSVYSIDVQVADKVCVCMVCSLTVIIFLQVDEPLRCLSVT